MTFPRQRGDELTTSCVAVPGGEGGREGHRGMIVRESRKCRQEQSVFVCVAEYVVCFRSKTMGVNNRVYSVTQDGCLDAEHS